jgi:hypothetical protein
MRTATYPASGTRATRPAPSGEPPAMSGDFVVYDMYPWNPPADGSASSLPSRPGAARRATRVPRRVRATLATQALQMALDRRDNGGESPVTVGQ